MRALGELGALGRWWQLESGGSCKFMPLTQAWDVPAKGLFARTGMRLPGPRRVTHGVNKRNMIKGTARCGTGETAFHSLLQYSYHFRW